MVVWLALSVGVAQAAPFLPFPVAQRFAESFAKGVCHYEHECTGYSAVCVRGTPSEIGCAYANYFPIAPHAGEETECISRLRVMASWRNGRDFVGYKRIGQPHCILVESSQ